MQKEEESSLSSVVPFTPDFCVRERKYLRVEQVNFVEDSL